MRQQVESRLILRRFDAFEGKRYQRRVILLLRRLQEGLLEELLLYLIFHCLSERVCKL